MISRASKLSYMGRMRRRKEKRKNNVTFLMKICNLHMSKFGHDRKLKCYLKKATSTLETSGAFS